MPRCPSGPDFTRESAVRWRAGYFNIPTHIMVPRRLLPPIGRFGKAGLLASGILPGFHFGGASAQHTSPDEASA
ncbi:MAG: hypothetical protein KDD43_10715 [Bdellovibrionales bacterium]|nr:hypothetical protein [Bdellovibrionales bacterium]